LQSIPADKAQIIKCLFRPSGQGAAKVTERGLQGRKSGDPFSQQVQHSHASIGERTITDDGSRCGSSADIAAMRTCVPPAVGAVALPSGFRTSEAQIPHGSLIYRAIRR